ncbi:MAG: hypothetical protein KDJ35_09485 [Alphaproteobacteria bacterium]|nr:hypothetical protein [Alphaproteobacteria bacterium]
MDSHDTPQHEIDQKNADNNAYSGNSAYAQNKRWLSNGSRNASYSNNMSSDEREERKRYHQKQGHISAYIHLHLEGLRQDIERLEKEAAEYAARARELGLEIEENTASIHVFKGVKETLSKYGEDATYADFLKDKYGDKVFTTESGNAWEAMQTPLRDDEGNMVYSDSHGELYRLQLDENGAPVINEETGAPVRVYYTDANEIADLMARAFDEESPEAFAQYTAKGQDPTNNRFKEFVAIETKNGEETPMPGAAVTIYMEEEATLGDIDKICDANICILEDENEIAAQEKLYVEAKEAETLEKAAQKRQDLLEEYQKRETDGTLTEEDKRDYAALKEELKREGYSNESAADPYCDDGTCNLKSSEGNAPKISVNPDENEFSLKEDAFAKAASGIDTGLPENTQTPPVIEPTQKLAAFNIDN